MSEASQQVSPQAISDVGLGVTVIVLFILVIVATIALRKFNGHR